MPRKYVLAIFKCFFEEEALQNLVRHILENCTVWLRIKDERSLLMETQFGIQKPFFFMTLPNIYNIHFFLHPPKTSAFQYYLDLSYTNLDKKSQ